jgi:hypothetical protein
MREISANTNFVSYSESLNNQNHQMQIHNYTIIIRDVLQEDKETRKSIVQHINFKSNCIKL